MSKGTCEVCGQTRTSLRMNHQKNMCGQCQSVYADVFNRMELLADVVHTTGKLDEFLKLTAGKVGDAGMVRAIGPYLPEQMTVDLGDGLLDDIAELVGCESKRSEDLIEAVRQLVGWRTEYGAERELQARAVVDPADKEELTSAQAALTEICRHVGVDDTNQDLAYKWIVVAVAQTAAALEQSERYGSVADGDLLSKADILVRIGKVIGHAGPAADLPGEIEILVGDLADLRTTMREQIEAWEVIATAADARSYAVEDVIAAALQSEAIIEDMMRMTEAEVPADLPGLIRYNLEELVRRQAALQAKQDQISLTADQLAEAEQRLLADEQIFARIREAMDADGLANGDLPAAVSALLYDASEPLPSRTTNPLLAARLLDLLLDYPEIGLERIAEIREVA